MAIRLDREKEKMRFKVDFSISREMKIQLLP
jgi:hypothetical protein